MAFLLCLLLAAPMSLLLAMGGGVRTTMASFGVSYTAMAWMIAMAVGIQGIRLRRGAAVRGQTYAIAIALIGLALDPFTVDSIHLGARWLLQYGVGSLERAFARLVEFGIVAFLALPAALMVRGVEAIVMTARPGSRPVYSEASTLDSRSFVAALAVLLFPWVALVAWISLDGPDWYPPWSDEIGAKGAAGLVFSSSFPLIAPGAVLLGYAYDRALGWKDARLRRCTALACVVALGIAAYAWPWLPSLELQTTGVPKAWHDWFVIRRPELMGPILVGSAAMVSVAFLLAASAMFASRRGARPLPLLPTVALLVAEYVLVRRLIPRFGPEVMPLIALAAMAPFASVIFVGRILRPRAMPPPGS